MDIYVNSLSTNSICEGCLSVDRKLTPINEGEPKNFFRDILGSLEYINHPLALCWECLAVIKTTLRFKKQVLTAHQNLVRFILRQTTNLTSLSYLKISKTNHEFHLIAQTALDETSEWPKLDKDTNFIETDKRLNTYTDNQNLNSIIENTQNTSRNNGNTEEPSLTQNNTQNRTSSTRNISPITIKIQNSSLTNVKSRKSSKMKEHNRKNDEIEPLTFIKIEGKDELGFHVYDDFFMDEDSEIRDDNDESKVGDDDLKAVLKSDPSMYEIPLTKPRKSKKVKTKTKCEDFDESDDEPLNMKRSNEDAKERKRGKKRKQEDGSKSDESQKNPRAKREKRSGVVNNPRVMRKLQELNVASGQLEMVVLSWEEVEAERQRALNNVVFTRHEYRCYDCVLGFNHKFKLENHMKKHDPSSGPLSCSVCRVRCRDAHALGAHRRRHRVRWRCCSCGGAWSRAAVAADHHARAHAAPPPTHTCPRCGHCETTLSKLRNHIKNHLERQKCELCGKTFRDRTSLRTHLFIHKGEKEYSCPQCGKQFLFKKAMEVHMVTHEAPAHLYCYRCDMNFKNRMSYYQHMKYNLKHIDPAKLKYACQLCDKKFVKATRLEEHNVAVHLKTTPIKCTVPGCNFSCASRPVLRTHTRMLHRNARAKRDHVCHTCGKAYTTKKTLEGHMRTHTGERPFRCTLCPSTFGYEAALYNHNKLVHLKAKTGRGRTLAPSVSSVPPSVAVPPCHPTVPPANSNWQLTLNITQAQTQPHTTNNIS